MKREKIKEGRPTKYSKELADRICKAVSTKPYGLQKICSEYSDFPAVDTIREWRLDHEYFSAKYARAKLHQAELLAEDCLDIADDSMGDLTLNSKGEEIFNSEFATRSKIRIDTRKWLASKLLPKAYGDRTQVENTVTIKHEDALKDLE